MNRGSKLFKDPDEYYPERFLGDARYASDAQEALKPFHTGTRDCVGKRYGAPAVC